MILTNLTTNTSYLDSFQLLETFFPMVVVTPILGFPANAYVLWILLRKHGLCSTSNIFTANLAMLDALCCLVQPFEIIIAILSPPEELVLHSMLFNQFAGPLFQVCTCVDCYIGVLHPVIFLKFKMPKFRLALCAAVWTMTCIVSILPYFFGSNATMLECMAGFLIGELGIMSFCSIHVLWALKKPGPGSQHVHPAKLRAHRIVLTLLIMVMVHYVTPVVNFLMISFKHVKSFSLFTIVAFMLACISSCNHPFFFLLRSGKISSFFCHKS